jgi:hypothetical protein
MVIPTLRGGLFFMILESFLPSTTPFLIFLSNILAFVGGILVFSHRWKDQDSAFIVEQLTADNRAYQQLHESQRDQLIHKDQEIRELQSRIDEIHETMQKQVKLFEGVKDAVSAN